MEYGQDQDWVHMSKYKEQVKIQGILSEMFWTYNWKMIKYTLNENSWSIASFKRGNKENRETNEDFRQRNYILTCEIKQSLDLNNQVEEQNSQRWSLINGTRLQRLGYLWSLDLELTIRRVSSTVLKKEYIERTPCVLVFT